MSKNKNKGLLDELAYTRQFFNRADAEKNKSDYGDYFSSKDKKKHRNKPSISNQVRIASKYKQAIVKITKYGRDTSSIKGHISYISRNYRLELEDQSGHKILDKKSASDLLNKWDALYFDHKTNSRNTAHIIFSAPKGTDRDAFNSTIRDCLKEEFGGRNDYIFAQHDDTDHPHAHVVLALRSIKGSKLDPKKQYLFHLRSFFAKKCRENGIQVEASRRFERGLCGKSKNSSMTQMYKKRGVIPKQDIKLKNILKTKGFTREESENKRNIQIRKDYYSSAENLFLESKNEKDKSEKKRKVLAAKLLLDFSKSMPNEPSRLEQLNMKVLKNHTDSFDRDSSEISKDNNQELEHKSNDREVDL